MAGPAAPVLAGHSYKGRTLATSLGTGVGGLPASAVREHGRRAVPPH